MKERRSMAGFALAVMLFLALACGSASAGWYFEGVFLDHDEINDLFLYTRGEVPYAQMTETFHVTTAYMQEELHPEWYGQKVRVHIVAYASQKIQDDNGSPTGNEGFSVVLKTDLPELQSYLDSLSKNFHITGSFELDARYTEQIDFSTGVPLDIWVEGTFGYMDQEGILVMEPSLP